MSVQHTIIRLLSIAAVGVSFAMTPLAHSKTLRIASNFPSEHTASQAMVMFKEEVEDATNGDLTINLFPDMQLGGASENVDQVRSGVVFAVVSSIAYYTRVVPEFEAVSLPFIFPSREAAFRVMDGPVGEIFNKKMDDAGFVTLGYGELGFRHVTNNVRAITSVDDFKGMKIRLQPNEVHLATFRALGANPVSMDVSELYSALQQGVLDGQENPYNIIATRRFVEVQDHLSDTGHFYDFINVVANKRQFEQLSPEHQEIIRTAMKNAMDWQREEAARLDESWREKLIAEGITFTPISDDLRSQLRDATSSVADLLKKRIDPDIIDSVIEEASS